MSSRKKEIKKKTQVNLGYNPQCPRCGFDDKIEREATVFDYPDGKQTGIKFSCRNCGTIFEVYLEA